MSRAANIASVCAALLVGALTLLAGLDRERLVCERARGACTLTSGALATDTRELSLDAITDHRFVTSSGKGGPRGATVLLDHRGAELRVASDGEAAAREKFDRLHAFFTGASERVDLATGPSWWLVAFGIGLLLAAPLLARANGRRAGPPAREREPAPRRNLAPFIAIAIGALVLIALALSTYSSRTQGTLVLRCTQRCDFGGLTCMPGGETSMTLPPGEHEVLIYNPDDPGAPIRRRVTLVRGQVSVFECAR